MIDELPDGDEEEDDGSVRCIYCDSTDACEHLLLYFDATFGSAEGGIVDTEALKAQVAKAFATALRDGKNPAWYSSWLEEAFEQIRPEEAERIKRAEEPDLPEWNAGKFLIELLEDAGGVAPVGEFLSQSGGRCTSAMLVCYAENAKAVSKKAKAMLAKRLEADLNPKRKGRRRT